MPQLDPYGLELLKQMLTYDTARRISGKLLWPLFFVRIGVDEMNIAKRALVHKYFEGFTAL